MMKHLRKFNEDVSKTSFKNSNSDIEMFFVDYTDDDPDALSIKDALIYDNRVVNDTTYMRDPSKYRRCKIIELTVGKSNGINTKNDGQCFNNFNILEDAVFDIKRFYTLSGEDVNFTINTDYNELKITFILLGDIPRSDEDQSDKINEYLKKISDCFKRKGHKRGIKIIGNWLDMKFTKVGSPTMGWDYYISKKLEKIGNGIITLDNTSDVIDKEIIEVRNDAWENGLKFGLSGGDNQVVLKFIKR